MGKLFGTDGIRGRAGAYPLDARTIAEVGFLLAEFLRGELRRPPRFLIGRDTRESGPWLETAIVSGFHAAEATVESVDIMTTPGVAFLTNSNGFDAGIVISASHNPFYDNGIKVFLPSGRKLPEDAEAFIESRIGSNEISESKADLSSVRRGSASDAQYMGHARALFSGMSLDGIKVVLDCANGASSLIAPEIFRTLGASVEVIGASPDGKNINEGCGSLHMDGLRNKVRESGADLGIAFDGDADRALLCDSTGELIDGDGILWIVARHMLERGHLEPKKVVATVMSNVGLELALASHGVELVRTDVGDKYVLDELIRSGGRVGGEQSGHVIFPQTSLVGDGIVTALKVLEVLSEKGVTLTQALEGFTRYPQILVNVPVSSKPSLDSIDSVATAISDSASELEGRGRILVRYSGTENVSRVMVEGDDQTMIERIANAVSDAIREAIGNEAHR